MVTDNASLVSPELQQAVGKWSEPKAAPKISDSDIRRWAIATYWPSEPPRLYWDEGFAKGTRWGGIVAPRDFNPFAWPVTRPVVEALPGLADRKLTNLNGGQIETYGKPQRPGDVITERTRILDFKEREGSKGRMLITRVESEWTNQHGELVRRRISTYITY